MISLRTSLAGFTLVLLSACSDSSPPPAAVSAGTAPRLASVTVAPEKVRREIIFDGTLEAINQSTVSAQTSGRVVALPFDVGDTVEQGAVIVRLTTTEQQARSAAAEAALAEATSRLAEAQLNYDRIKDIYARRAVPKAQFDKAAADLDSARARRQAAQAALAGARESLGYTLIRAPYAGIVVARQVQLGETVTPGRPLMTGVSLDHLRVLVDVPQQQIDTLRRHRQARVILADGNSLEAEKLRIPPNANPATHSFQVRVDLPAGAHGLSPGTLVKVAFVSGEDTRLMLPPAAVVRRGELTGVYVLEAKGVRLRYLRLGTPAANGAVPVLAGLESKERVALDPVAAAVAYKQQAQPPGGTP